MDGSINDVLSFYSFISPPSPMLDCNYLARTKGRRLFGFIPNKAVRQFIPSIQGNLYRTKYQYKQQQQQQQQPRIAISISIFLFIYIYIYISSLLAFQVELERINERFDREYKGAKQRMLQTFQMTSGKSNHSIIHSFDLSRFSFLFFFFFFF